MAKLVLSRLLKRVKLARSRGHSLVITFPSYYTACAPRNCVIPPCRTPGLRIKSVRNIFSEVLKNTVVQPLTVWPCVLLPKFRLQERLRSSTNGVFAK